VLLRRDLQSCFDGFVEILARPWSEAGETLHELALAIEHERLGDAVIIAEQESYEIFVRLCEGVLNSELLREIGHFLIVTWPTDIEADYYESLGFILLLHVDQMRHAVATRRTPGGVEIEDQHFPAVLGKHTSLSVRLPTHVGECRSLAGRRHRISRACWWLRNDRRVGVGDGRDVVGAARE